MSERAMLEITNKRLGEIGSGFVSLKERKLPNIQVDLRVAAQYKKLLPFLEVYNEVRKKAISEHEVPGPDAGNDVKLQNKIELRKKLDELDAIKISIPAPLKRLTKDDLPVVVKGENADNNAMGLAGIMIALAPEFFDLPEEEA